MDFGAALKALKEGKRVARKGWNGVGMWLELQKPDMFSYMTLPYIYIEYPKNPKHHAYPDGSRCPWIASQTDMLSEDWFIIEDVVEPTEFKEFLDKKNLEEKSKRETVFDKANKEFESKVDHLLNALFGDEEGVEVHVIRVHN